MDDTYKNDPPERIFEKPGESCDWMSTYAYHYTMALVLQGSSGIVGYGPASTAQLKDPWQRPVLYSNILKSNA